MSRDVLFSQNSARVKLPISKSRSDKTLSILIAILKRSFSFMVSEVLSLSLLVLSRTLGLFLTHGTELLESPLEIQQKNLTVPTSAHSFHR